jgi:hypothetical protein
MAVICGSFIVDPQTLGFRALVILSRIVELAITAAMQMGVTPGAGIRAPNMVPAEIRNLLTAFPARKGHQ